MAYSRSRSAAWDASDWGSPALGTLPPSLLRSTGLPGPSPAKQASPTLTCGALAQEFGRRFRRQCPGQTVAVANIAALAGRLAALRRDGATLAELDAAIDTFCTLVASGSISVKGKPAWKVFLVRLPQLVENTRQAPDMDRDEGLTPEERQAALLRIKKMLA